MNLTFPKARSKYWPRGRDKSVPTPSAEGRQVAPHSDETKAINLGEAAHIRAARPGQARYDANMTDKQRGAISNGIWLCKECARRIDVDEAKYSVSLLVEWKEKHEKWVSDGKPEIAGKRSSSRTEASAVSYVTKVRESALISSILGRVPSNESLLRDQGSARL